MLLLRSHKENHIVPFNNALTTYRRPSCTTQDSVESVIIDTEPERVLPELRSVEIRQIVEDARSPVLTLLLLNRRLLARGLLRDSTVCNGCVLLVLRFVP